MQQYLVGSDIVGKEAGAVTVALKRSQLRNVPLLFRWIESSLSKDPAHPGAALLKEWSISNSTLEEVFLRLCAADTTVNAGIDRPDDSAQDDDAQRKCAVCRVRPVSVVTLYTAGGVPVVLPNILCGPCSFGSLLAEQKAREEEEARTKALMESNDPEDTSERIQWSLDPTTSPSPSDPQPVTGAPTNGDGRPPALSPGESIQSSVGKVPPTLWQQTRAVYLKNASMAWTEKKGWCARLCVLVVMVAMVVVFAGFATQPSFRTMCPQGFLQPGGSCADPVIRQYLFDTSGIPLDSTAYSYSNVSTGTVNGSWTQPSWLQCSGGLCYPTLVAGSGPNVVLVSRDGGPGLLGYDVGLGQVGVLNFTQPLPSSARTLPPVFVDWTAQLQSTGLSVGQQVLANEQLVQQRAAAPPAYSNCGATGVWWFNDSAAALALARWLYPDVAITIKGQRASGAGDSYLSVELSWFVWEGSSSVPAVGYSTPGGCNTFSISRYLSSTAQQAYVTFGPPRNILHGLANALLYTALQNASSYPRAMGSAAWRNASSPIILGLVNPLNTLSFPIASNDGVIGMVTCFLLFPSLLLLPWFADRVLYEREEELYHQMAIAGLRPSAYWLGNYLFDSTVSWLWCATLIIAGYASGSPLFVSVTPFLWLLLYLVWIHAQLGVAWFITVFFTRRRAASVLIYLFVIVVSAGSFGYSAFLYSRVSWPWYLNLLPPLTFMRALSWVVRYPLTVSQALAVGSPFADSLNATLWIGTAMMAIAVLAHALRYQSVEQLLSAIPWYKERSRLLKESEENKLKGDERIADAGFLPIAPDSTSAEDEDVQLERQRVIDAQQSAVGEARAISILNLRKSFTSGGWADRAWTAMSSLWMSHAGQDARKSRVINAVNGLFLGMDYGDCFGLLGPNGAGKV